MKNLSVLLLASTFLLPVTLHAEDKAPVAASETSKDYVMLKVNGEGIKKSEIDDIWKTVFQGREAPPLESLGENMKDKFLNEVASERALYQEGMKEGVEKSPEFNATLEKVKRQLVIQQLLKDKTKDAITDAALKAAYDAHLKEAGASGTEEYHARHILVKTKEEAEAIEKKLKKGAKFETLAKEKSDDKGSGASGGDLGWFTADKMVPEFSAVVEKLKKGEISQPVKTEFGWHIIQLEDRRKATPPAFADVRESLKQEVSNKVITDYVKGLMKDVKVEEVDADGHEKPLPADISAKDAAPAR